MKPEQIVDACEKRGVKLRINPDDGKLEAYPRRKVPQDLLIEIRKHRAELIEFVEARDGGGQALKIEDLPPPEPRKPSIAEQIIAAALAQGFVIRLDIPGPTGVIKVDAPWQKRMVPDPTDPHNGDPKKGKPWVEAPVIELGEIAGTAMPGADYVAQQRAQIPPVLAAQIQNYRPELLLFLRAPYLPDPGPEPVEPKARSVWERYARPDRMIPDARSNQDRIKHLLTGNMPEDRHTAARRNQLDRAIPVIMEQHRGVKK